MCQLALAVGTAAALRLGLCHPVEISGTHTRKDLLVDMLTLCSSALSERKEDWREIWLLKTGPDTVMKKQFEAFGEKRSHILWLTTRFA